MSDVNDRLIEAVRDVILKYPQMDTDRALHFALDADAQLASDYHHAGDDGAIDPGFGDNGYSRDPPGVVRSVPVARAGGSLERRHFSQLTPAEKAAERGKILVHKLADEAHGGFFWVDLPAFHDPRGAAA